MHWTRSLVALILAVAVAVTAATVALAASAADPNDTPGKLDLKLVKGVESSGLLTLTVGTWDRWSKADVPLVGSPNRLVVLIDTNENGTVDYRARIVSSGGVLVAVLSGHGNSFEPIPVTRSGNRVRFTFPTDVLKPGDDIAIAATSTYRRGACSPACIDRAPNAGWIAVG